MIYGDIIYEQQFENIVNINPIIEFYQNEISILESVNEMSENIISFNEADDVVVHSKFINADHSEKTDGTKEVVKKFVKKAIDKIKEIIKKFIEWCKKIASTIKGFFVKDIDKLTKENEEDLKKIDKAKSFSEVRRAARHIGSVKKVNGKYNIYKFNGLQYITESFEHLNSVFPVFINLNSTLVPTIMKELDKDGTLSDKTKKEATRFIETVKSISDASISNNKKSTEYLVRYAQNINDLENFKRTIKHIGTEDIKALQSIKNMSNDISKKIQSLESDSNRILNQLNHINGDGFVSNDIALATSVINATLSAGKALYNEKLKVLNTTKNIYAHRSQIYQNLR